MMMYDVILKVLEGTNVTLETTLEKLEKQHRVKWTHSDDCRNKLIAQWNNFNISINETFKDTVQMDQHKGSITLISVTKNFTGVYCVRVLEGTNPHPTVLRKHLVTVYSRCLKCLILHVVLVIMVRTSTGTMH